MSEKYLSLELVILPLAISVPPHLKHLVILLTANCDYATARLVSSWNGWVFCSKLFIFNLRLSQFERMRHVIRRQHKVLATEEDYIYWLHQFSTRSGPCGYCFFA